MQYDLEATIVARASAPGGAARGIVRVSGPAVARCLSACFVAKSGTPFTARVPRCWPGTLRLDGIRFPIPADLYFWPSYRSYPCHPLAELHTLGSPPLLQAPVRTLCHAVARVASPGEYTLRAFLGGRLDLTQAEAVLGVIDAPTRRELDLALVQLAGGLRDHMHRLREKLLELLAHLEAGLDFVDEDIEFIAPAELRTALEAIVAEVRTLQDQARARTWLGEAPRVILCGAPNAGKSSLFNALVAEAGATPALVSDVPGTTRDYLLGRWALDGLDCILCDTAGVIAARGQAHDFAKHEPHASPENQAQQQTQAQTAAAHLLLWCLDGSQPRESSATAYTPDPTGPPWLKVLTKQDLLSTGEKRDERFSGQEFLVSARTGAGLEELRRAVRTQLMELAPSGGLVAGTATRCAESLRNACDALERARDLVAYRGGDELIAWEIRLALDELGHIVGAIYTDDLLDRIFSRFCIGK